MEMGPILRRLRSRAFERQIPFQAMLVLTERCHLRCQQCYLVANPRPELSTAKILSVLDELADAGTMFVALTGGEPLLRADIYDIIRHARDRAMMVTIFTTATPCNPERVERLVEAGLHRASISVYAADPEIHDEVTQVPGSFAKTLEGIRNLDAAGVMVQMKFLQMTTNLDQLLPTKALAESLGAQFSIDLGLTVCHDSRRDPLKLQVQEEALLDIQRHLMRTDPEGIGKIVPRPRDMDAPACPAGHTRLVVGTDGKVYPCLDFRDPVGDITQQSLRQIWSDAPVQQTRKIKRFGDPICRVCPDRDFCSRCPSQADLDSGDASGPSPILCLKARVKRRVYEEKQAGLLEPVEPGLQAPPVETPQIRSERARPSTPSCGDCSCGTLQREVEKWLKQPPRFNSPTT